MKMTGRSSAGTRSLACQRSSKFDGTRRPRMPTSLSMAPVHPDPAKMTTVSSSPPTASRMISAGVLAQPRRLQAGARALGVRVGVAGEHLVADEVLDEGQGAARGGVVGVGDAAWAVGPVHHLVVADDAARGSWRAGRRGRDRLRRRALASGYVNVYAIRHVHNVQLFDWPRLRRRLGNVRATSHRVERVTAISYPLVERRCRTACASSSRRTTPSPTSPSTSGSVSAPATRAPAAPALAHLFEHLMFQGSRNVASGEHFSRAHGRGRPPQRDDVVRPHQLLRDDPHRRPRARPVARGRPPRLPARRRDPGEPRQPAGRRQGGEAPALRQRALRLGAHRHLRHRLPRGPPVPPPDDRVDGGSRRRDARGRPCLLSARTTAPTTPC